MFTAMLAVPQPPTCPPRGAQAMAYYLAAALADFPEAQAQTPEKLQQAVLLAMQVGHAAGPRR
jgi:hypothetical protein